jgi:hypothetical protein
VTHTILRGRVAYSEGEVVGEPRGEFIRRPVGARARERVAVRA